MKNSLPKQNPSSTWLFAVALVTLTLALSACTKDHLVPNPSPGGGSGGEHATPTPTPTPFIDENAVNVVKFGVNDPAYCSSGSYTNKPCVSVTVCNADGVTCQVIHDILIDTGSYGLRVFKSKMTNLNLAASGNLAECMEYGDGSKQWGPVKLAKVKIGNEPMVSIPIHEIDNTYPGMTDKCSGAERAEDAGFSGILGIGVFQADCGPHCANNANNNVYFNCAGSTCTSTTVPQANQVQNPIGFFPVDNNGVAVQLPSVPASGLPSVTGYLIFGVGTRSNNVPSGTTTFPTDPTYGEITTEFNSVSYRSFIDSGSNALGIPPNRSLPDCDYDLPGWICPSSTLALNATMIGNGGGPQRAVNFSVASFRLLFGSGNAAFSNSAYLSSSNITGFFDWGLPFYFGRTVYLGIENHSSPVGAGTYWAY